MHTGCASSELGVQPPRLQSIRSRHQSEPWSRVCVPRNTKPAHVSIHRLVRMAMNLSFSLVRTVWRDALRRLTCCNAAMPMQARAAPWWAIRRRYTRGRRRLCSSTCLCRPLALEPRQLPQLQRSERKFVLGFTSRGPDSAPTLLWVQRSFKCFKARPPQVLHSAKCNADCGTGNGVSVSLDDGGCFVDTIPAELFHSG